VINVHAAKLPWGRGIGPTLFSVLLGYASGVSIHLIDSGLDTGDLILESDTVPTPDDTLRTIYKKLLGDCDTLFADFLRLLFADGLTRQRQRDIDPRCFARNRQEFETVLEMMPLGYDTSLSDVAKLGQAMRKLKAARQLLSPDSL
jgi:methionyl-tRNA formyltransferase